MMVDAARVTKSPVTVVLVMEMRGLEAAATLWHHPLVHATQVPLSYAPPTVVFVLLITYQIDSALLLQCFAGETDFTHATQDEDHGAPASQRVTMTEEGRGGAWEGVGNITFPHSGAVVRTVPVLSHPMPMATIDTWLLMKGSIKKSDGSMSGKNRNSITCWSKNGNQLLPGQDSLGMTTRRRCCLLVGFSSCRPLNITRHISLGCTNEF